MKNQKNYLCKSRVVFLALLQLTLMLLALPHSGLAASVSLQWQPSTDADLVGYRVYYQAHSAALPFNGTGAAEGTAPVDMANTTTATISGLDPANSYFFAVTAYNSAGIESRYSNIIEVAEALPPVVAITSPTANASATGVVSVSAAASDNVGVTGVEFYVNGALQGSVSAAPYLYAWNTSALTPGSYTLSAKAYDAAGNVGQSADVLVKVGGDTIPPNVAVTAPGDAALLSGSVTVTASASDDIGVTRIEVYDNGTLAFASNEGSASYNWDTTQAVNGSHTLSAKGYDAAGNVGQSATVTVSVLNDSTAPAVALASVGTGAIGGVVNVSANASDDVAVTRVEFYLNGALQATTTSAPYGFGWNTATVPNGSYTLSAKAFDAAGNVGQSGTVTVAVLNDTTAPAVSIISPTTGTAAGTVSVAAAASDDVAVLKVEFYLNGALQSTATSVPYSYNWNTANVVNGSYTLTAKAYDAAGNIGQSGGVAVTIFNDTVAPSVAIASPVNGGTARGTLAVSATASDNDAVAKVEFYLNGALQTTTTDAPYTFTWNTAAVANGTYTVTVKAYDRTGNIGQASSTVTIFNDTTAPTVSMVSPATGSTARGTVTVSASAADNVGVTRVEFYLNGTLASTVTSAPYSFDWNTATGENGSYTLTAKAYDVAGNVGQSTSTVNVANDATSPVVTFAAPTSTYVYGNKVRVSASSTDNLAVIRIEMYVDGALKLSTNQSSFDINWNFPKGIHTIDVKAYDAANNVGSLSKSIYRFN